MATRPDIFRIYGDEEAMLKVYNRRLRMADSKFDKTKDEKQAFVDRYGNETEGDQVTEDGHVVSVTSGIGIVDTMYSSMVAVDVEFICDNIGNGTEMQAIAATRALNQAWRDTKAISRTKGAIKDSLLVDIGWVKVYYDYQEADELRDKPDEALEEELLAYMDAHGLTEIDEEGVAQAVAANELSLTEQVKIVLRDRVCIDYVPWDLIRVDPTAKRIEDVRWVAQYTPMPVEEVHGNPEWEAFVEQRYGKTEGHKRLTELEGDTTIVTGLENELTSSADWGDDEFGDDQRITVVELWDFETGLVTVFPKNNEELVLHQRINPLMMNVDLEDRNPFKPLVVRSDPRKLEGLGDMRIIWPALEELDEYRSNAATYVARTIPKYFGPEDALTQNGKDAFKSPEWGEYVGLSQGYTKDMIGQVEIPRLPQEAFAIPEQVAQEMKEATGASEPMRGIFPTRRTTATETQIVTGSGEQRQAERRGSLEQWYLAIARTMLQLMQVFYDQKRMLRYTDDLGQEFVWHWSNEDISIDADINIAITPKESFTRDERVQRAMQLMNLALPLPETDRGELLRWVAREMGIRDDISRKFIRSDQEVQAQQNAQQAQSAAQQILPVAPPRGQAPGLQIG